jgi:y4mF family transcriptional regulator
MPNQSTIDDKNSERSPFGDLIRSLRKERKLTQLELASRSGVSFSFINQVEGGKTTLRLDTLNKLLGVFGYRVAPVKIERGT